MSKVDSHHDVFRVEVQQGAPSMPEAGPRGSPSPPPPPSDAASMSASLQAYVGAWNTGDPAARAALLHQCWSESARYVDPANDARGPGGLDATILAFRGQLPGASIVPLTGAIEAHGLVHFRWRVEDGEPQVVPGRAGPAGSPNRPRRVDSRRA
ncbi:nuclear transport factor 2 family protein [Sorangium sp. So ce118]